MEYLKAPVSHKHVWLSIIALVGILALFAYFVVGLRMPSMAQAATPESLWPTTTIPATVNNYDGQAIQVGVKFRTALAGNITGIRFYKGTQDTGSHTGTLWSSTGTQLRTGTFSGETASGWQTLTFSAPVAVTANTIYVAAYRSPTGRYPADNNYFAADRVSGNLTAPSSAGVSGGNGVYKYGAHAFPNLTYGASNYWVDVLFDTGTTTPPPPVDTIAPSVPQNLAATAASTTQISLSWSASTDAVGVTGYHINRGGVRIATTTVASYLDTGRTPATLYSYTVSAFDAAKNESANSASASATTLALPSPPPPKPTISSFSANPTSIVNGSSSTLSWSVTNASSTSISGIGVVTGTSRVVSPTVTTQYTLTATNPQGSVTALVTVTVTQAPLPPKPTITSFSANPTSVVSGSSSTLSWAVTNASSTSINNGVGVVTGTNVSVTPANTTTYILTATNPQGSVTSTATVTVTQTPPATTTLYSIWPSNPTPGNPADSDASAVELGVKFRSDVSGFITGIRFYKGAGNGGTHTGHLWSSAGTLLGTATFSGESASGWQQASFPSPVAITANTTYVASYFAPQGRYAGDNNYFASGVDTAPLHALSNAAAPGNGVYRYGSTSGFPSSTFGSSNYWVDVLFSPSGTIPLQVVGNSPTNGATNMALGTAPTVTFNKALDPASVSSASAFIKDGSGTLVPATVTYSAANLSITLTPTSPLTQATTYTVTIKGGATAPRVTDTAGASLASDFTASFSTLTPPPPPQPDGPGGPILIITSTANPFSRYLAEVVRAEGLNSFLTMDVAQVSASTLANYDVAVLGDISLTQAQVDMLATWVDGGGNLIAMRPDKKLSTLLGITDASGTLADKYYLVNTSQAPGQGIVSQTMQFHGPADLYTLSGATAVATLYSSASLPTTNPALTLRSVGVNGGHAAAFTFDLARSVVYTRQGNPAWVGQERDNDNAGPVIRADDMFYPDYLDLNKVAIPQADELQRLFANTITLMQSDGGKKPLPHFWYFPNMFKAILVSASDDHAANGTASYFNSLLSASPAGCTVADWTCLRSTSWMYTSGNMTSSAANQYFAQGFDLGVHINTGCNNASAASMANSFVSEIAGFRAKYPGLPPQTGNRVHCISWSGWAEVPKISLNNGIRIDMGYYYWPSAWIQNRPGFFNGSGVPMRYADLDGSTIDVFQLASHIVNENGESYPSGINARLDKALGAEGYYGAFGTHFDYSDSFSTTLLNAVLARGGTVPMISADQLLKWTDSRNASSFSNLAWSANTLSFTTTIAPGATNLYALLPIQNGPRTLSSFTNNGTPVSYTTQTIKGVSYAVFKAALGTYSATYQ